MQTYKTNKESTVKYLLFNGGGQMSHLIKHDGYRYWIYDLSNNKWVYPMYCCNISDISDNITEENAFLWIMQNTY